MPLPTSPVVGPQPPGQGTSPVYIQQMVPGTSPRGIYINAACFIDIFLKFIKMCKAIANIIISHPSRKSITVWNRK